MSITMAVNFMGILGLRRPRAAPANLQSLPEAQQWARPHILEAWRRCREDHRLQPGTVLFQAQSPQGLAIQPDLSAGPAQPEEQDGQGQAAGLLPLSELLSSYLAGSDIATVVCDARATALHIHAAGAEPELMPFLREGLSWAEHLVGNNGIGTAALLGYPAIFQGSEHYAPDLNGCGTAGYPIFSPQGRILAVLGAVSPHPDMINGALAFLSLAGSLVEAGLFAEQTQGNWVFRLSSPNMARLGMAEALLFDAMLAVGDDGFIMAANHSALTMLQESQKRPIIGQPLGTILNVGLYSLIGRSGIAGEPPVLHAASGQVFKVEMVAAAGQAGPTVLRRQIKKTGRAPSPAQMALGGHSLVTGDAVLDPLLPKLVQMQARKIPILITGESGVGKNHLVETLHQHGPRKDRPLITINTAGIPRDLIQSELFGYRSGSFTGAHAKGSPGKVIAADKGVLFLNEIGDMPFELQASLLHLLESSEVIPIGGTKPITVDIHVIAATNRSLQDEVRKGTFRQDLYYRLNGAEVCIPPLRERADKPWVFEAILRAEQKDLADSTERNFSPEAMKLFMQHPWPGNIRELRNIVRLVLTGMESETIGVADLPATFFEEMDIAAAQAAGQVLQSWMGVHATANLPGSSLTNWELHAVRTALEQSGGNVSIAARTLGITRTTLYRKMLQYELDPASVRAQAPTGAGRQGLLF